MTENENNDKRFKQEADDKKETEEPEPVDYKSVDYGEGYAQNFHHSVLHFPEILLMNSHLFRFQTLAFLIF